MKTGRPPKFDNPEDMEVLIHKYFIEDLPTKTQYSNGIPYKVPCPTITGLALYLGFCDRHSFYEYEKKPKFTHTIKKARAHIVRYYEELTYGSSAAGAIFMLKNFGYSDKQEIDMNARVTKMDKVKIDGKEYDFGYGDPKATGHSGEAAADS